MMKYFHFLHQLSQNWVLFLQHLIMETMLFFHLQKKNFQKLKKIIKIVNKLYFQVSYFFLIAFFLILIGLKLLLVPV